MDSVTKREYRHLFPDALLQGHGEFERDDKCSVLNCALITWNTNRNISSKDPLRYLRDRAEKSSFGEETIRHRLATHLTSYESLAGVGFAGLDGDLLRESVQRPYRDSLDAPAELMVASAVELCAGTEA